MITSETRIQLLNDDSLVQSHIETILLWYNLKNIHIDNKKRVTDSRAESVAEHIYGMHVLCNYFLPLESESLDLSKLRSIITWHDMAEALVGDMTSETKTDQHKKLELEAETKLIDEALSHQGDLREIFKEFHQQETRESQFVRAIDKLEPIFHLVFDSRQQSFKPFQWDWTAREDKEYRNQYLGKFPLLLRFDDVLSKELDVAGYFIDSK